MDMESGKLSRRSFLKKAAAASLVLGLGGSVASQCVVTVPQTQTSSGTTGTAPQAKAVDLTFWVIPYWKGRTGKEEDGTETDYYTWKVEEFNEEFPNASIKAEFIPSTFDGWAKFDTAVAAGNPPDVMWGQAGNQWKYAPQDAVEPFDDWMEAEVIADLHEPVKSICGYADNKIYLWPYGMAVAGGVFANKALFEKMGALDLLPSGAERAWTVAEFEKALAATTGEVDGEQVYGTAIMTDWSYQVTQFLYGFGADLYNEFQTKMVMNSPEGVEGLQWLVDLEHQNGWCAPGTAGRTNENVLRLFQEQKIAIMPSQPYYITAFRTAPELKPSFEWVFCQPPHKEDKQMGAEANVHGYLVAKQDDQDKLAMAMEFVKHLTKPENLEIACWGQGVVPPRKSMLNVLEGDQDRYVEGLIAANAKPWGRLYGEIGPKVLTPMWDAAFGLTKTPQEALDDAVEAGDKIIAETAEQFGWPMS
jgi:multiple sugar transport system substrate-binding protein